jgi:hypothetical protein
VIKDINTDAWLTVIKTPDYGDFGGTNVTIGAGWQLLQLVQQIQTMLAKEHSEAELRKIDPNVKLAYDAYKMAVALAAATAPTQQVNQV